MLSPIFMILLVIFMIILVCLLVMGIKYYNSFVKLENAVDNSYADIDVQLQRRNDLVPNLVSSVQGYMKHEKDLLMSVTNARSRIFSNANFSDVVSADKELSDGVKSIFALAENYPDLKANELFLDLQKQLSELENIIANNREEFNNAVLTYNNRIEMFPGSIFAKLFRFKRKELFIAETAAANVPVINL